MYRAQVLQQGGVGPSTIYRALSRECLKSEREITFNVDDIRNRFAASTADRILDCTNLLEHLKRCKEIDPQAEYDIFLDPDDGSLDRIYFVLKGAHTVWTRSDGNVLLYDTKHGTNKYGFKLGCFTCIDENGRTQVLAGSFLLSEDVPCFSWAFGSFDRVFSPPDVIFTDSDTAMASAIAKMWPDAIHLLCTFHIWKNFYMNIHPLFVNNYEGWKAVARMFWRLCKNSDLKFRDTFDDDFDNFVKLIKTTSRAGDEAVNKKLKWLDDLKGKKEK